jgi:hypothetical protein
MSASNMQVGTRWALATACRSALSCRAKSYCATCIVVQRGFQIRVHDSSSSNADSARIQTSELMCYEVPSSVIGPQHWTTTLALMKDLRRSLGSARNGRESLTAGGPLAVSTKVTERGLGAVIGELLITVHRQVSLVPQPGGNIDLLHVDVHVAPFSLTHELTRFFSGYHQSGLALSWMSKAPR